MISLFAGKAYIFMSSTYCKSWVLSMAVCVCVCPVWSPRQRDGGHVQPSESAGGQEREWAGGRDLADELQDPAAGGGSEALQNSQVRKGAMQPHATQ